MKEINVILYDNFTMLDAFGALEVLSRLENHTIGYYSLQGGVVVSSTGAQILTRPINSAQKCEILLMPGGFGTRSLVESEEFIACLRELAENSLYVLGVCTGSALLAKTGLLDGRQATSNKIAFTWVTSNGENVKWVKSARWVNDGKYYTSSGVSAGIDMALSFVRDVHGEECALKIARVMEYVMDFDNKKDPFAPAT